MVLVGLLFGHAVVLPQVVHAKNEVILNESFHGGKWNDAIWHVVEEKSNKNHELQTYTKKNSFMRDGKLYLQANQRATNYESGSIELKREHSFLYGKIEVRAKLPSGKGVFPAIWLLPHKDRAMPEIDMVESIGQVPDQIWGVYHDLDPQGVHRRAYFSYVGQSLSTRFHTYGLDWQPNQLIWTIDGNEIYRVNRAPHLPMFLILNVAIGGDWPGHPDQSTRFPQAMVVDFIRITKHG
jgi:beta-glucanase (GH16 family)